MLHSDPPTGAPWRIPCICIGPSYRSAQASEQLVDRLHAMENTVESIGVQPPLSDISNNRFVPKPAGFIACASDAIPDASRVPRVCLMGEHTPSPVPQETDVRPLTSLACSS